jgi:gamma-glutamyltranspeptidase
MNSGILKSNNSNTVKISLIDDYDNTATMTYTVYLYDMYITISDT